MSSNTSPHLATTGTPPNWRQDWEREWQRHARHLPSQMTAPSPNDRVYFGVAGEAATEEQHVTVDEHKLKSRQLPVLRDEQELANWLEISLSRLRWFTHDKDIDTVYHYRLYTIDKKSGGKRIILAPKKQIKSLQRKILAEILYNVPFSESCHGFSPGRSTTSNAMPHVEKDVVVNIDLENFFPSITFTRVRGLFISFGYSFSVSSALALLCTERNRREETSNDKTVYVGTSDRYLIQGSPTSPAIANLITRKLDSRLHGLAASKEFAYTRYADDLTFSGQINDIPRLISLTHRIIQDENFTVNTNKTRVFRKCYRQIVTGFVVNERVNAPRSLRRTIRAILHNSKTSGGLNSQNKANHPNFRAYISGLIGYIASANKYHADTLKKTLDKIPD